MELTKKIPGRNITYKEYVAYRRRRGTKPYPYGSALNVSNCVNNSYTTFANGVPAGFDATSDGAGVDRAGTADEVSFNTANSYFLEFDLVLNSGTAPTVRLAKNLAGTGIGVEGNLSSSAGANSSTFTVNWTGSGVVEFFNDNAATDYEVTNLAIRQIL